MRQPLEEVRDEIEAMVRELARQGHRVVGPGEPAELSILNTCTVTSIASKKSRQLIRQMRRTNPAAPIIATGCDVVDYGMAPTGVFYHAQATGPEEAGVVITGSHNPPEFNGFKLVLRGASFFGEQILPTAAGLLPAVTASGDELYALSASQLGA